MNYQYETENYGARGETANGQKVITRTYLFMFLVLLISAASAYVTATSEFGYELITGNSYVVMIVVELGVVMLATHVMRKDMVALSAIMLLLYSVINGMTLSTIFYVYQLSSIVNIFVMCAALFAAMSVFGFVTKKDLTGIGQIGIMSLFGIIILGVANIFIRSDSMNLALSVIGLAVFIGLTAYDTQRIKDEASYYQGSQINSAAMMGALCLYLDFVNIFLKLLRLFGERK